MARLILVAASIAFVIGLSVGGQGAEFRPVMLPPESGTAPEDIVRASEAVAQYDAVVRRLVAVASNPNAQDGYPRPIAGGPQERASDALGELRAQDAVSVLLERLPDKSERLVAPYGFAGSMAQRHPAAFALVEIGKPASLSALARIESAKEKETREVLAWIVMMVEGTNVAVFMLDSQAQKVEGPAKSNLEAAADWVREQPATESYFARPYVRAR